MENQLVVFKLVNEYYGIDISTVESIIKLQPITVVPHAPFFVEGVVNLRGAILPVIDLRKRFDLPPVEPTKDTRIVIVEINGVMAGMVVDAVTEVLRLPEESIDPLSPLVTTSNVAFIRSIAKLEDRLIILLDLEKVIISQEKTDLAPLSL